MALTAKHQRVSEVTIECGVSINDKLVLDFEASGEDRDRISFWTHVAGESQEVVISRDDIRDLIPILQQWLNGG